MGTMDTMDTFESDVYSVASESLVEDSLSLHESRIKLTLGMFDRLNDTIHIISSNTGSLDSELTVGRKSPIQKMFKMISREFSSILKDLGEELIDSDNRLSELRDDLNSCEKLQNKN